MRMPLAAAGSGVRLPSIRPLFWASRHFVPFRENIAEHLKQLALVIRPVQITGFLEDVAD